MLHKEIPMKLLKSHNRRGHVSSFVDSVSCLDGENTVIHQRQWRLEDSIIVTNTTTTRQDAQLRRALAEPLPVHSAPQPLAQPSSCLFNEEEFESF